MFCSILYYMLLYPLQPLKLVLIQLCHNEFLCEVVHKELRLRYPLPVSSYRGQRTFLQRRIRSAHICLLPFPGSLFQDDNTRLLIAI